jgi:hypothetical protein
VIELADGEASTVETAEEDEESETEQEEETSESSSEDADADELLGDYMSTLTEMLLK